MNPITLTDAAVQHIQSMLAKQPQSVGFRLSIKQTGCSGYAYVPEIIENINAEDIHFILHNELNVYLDAKNVSLLEGLHIDYVSEPGEGLKQKRLVYNNPHEKNRCGCGESFTVE